MKALSTKWHSRIDYLLAFTLIASPWLFYFSDNSIQTFIPVTCGLAIIAYSLLTNYELGFLKLIGIPLHTALDISLGSLLALSPWIFGFAGTVYLPHLVSGVLLAGTALVTRQGFRPLEAASRHSQAYAHYHFSAWLGHKE